MRYKLEGVSKDIWLMIPNSLKKILDVLKNKYTTVNEKIIEEDVKMFVTMLNKEGLVCIQEKE